MKDNPMAGIASRRRRTSKGSVFVETALIFMVFASMLIGAFDFGQFLFVHQALVERARYAARWGAINDATDSTSITNMVLYNQSSTPASGTATYFNLTSGNVSVSNPDSGTDNYRLQLQISGYSYSVLSPYIAGSYTGIPITVSVPLGLYH
jgi:Flp pilus assembly protein TadG